MIDIAELERRFTYHKPLPGQVAIYEQLRYSAKELAITICALTPTGREQSLAITFLEQTVSWANAAIARSGEAPEANKLTLAIGRECGHVELVELQAATSAADILRLVEQSIKESRKLCANCQKEDVFIDIETGKLLEEARLKNDLAQMATHLLLSTPDNELSPGHLALKAKIAPIPDANNGELPAWIKELQRQPDLGDPGVTERHISIFPPENDHP